MALFEGSYTSLLQGVSQQVPRQRLDGQLTAQVNMMSDPVSDLRRRPGIRKRACHEVIGATYSTIGGFETDIGGKRRHVVLDTLTGVVRFYDESFEIDTEFAPNPYLIAPSVRNIRWTTVGSELFFANTSISPTASAPTGTDPAQRGFFYIKAGSLNRTFQVSVSYGKPQTTISATYSTPTGTGAGDAALSTPEYIAQQLFTTLSTAAAGAIDIYRDGAFVYIEGDATIRVTTTTGDVYVVASGTSYIQQSANLPLKLPVEADGYIVATGSLQQPTYYKYVQDRLAWLECGDFESPGALENMPVSIRRLDDDSGWEYNPDPFEGRLAGDDESNPAPAFLERGITGLSSFQGRLVILCGNLVSMSASRKPRRFFRSTVTSVLDGDPIEVGAQANSSAAYEYAVQFQKDLLLFAEKYQALVPALTTAITPRTASVVITSTYDADMTSAPVTIGRTLMYPTPRSANFFGITEMMPSPYTDSQYISQDVTSHIPKYMAGRCRWAVSSSVANMALFGPSGDPYSAIVHEYLWDGDDKKQQAWHQWSFPFPVACAYFSGSDIIVVLVANDQVLHCSLDPRAGYLTEQSQTRPFLDVYFYADVVDHEVTLPAWLTALDPLARTKVRLSNAADTLSGEEVGVEDRTTDTLRTVRSFRNGQVAIGYSYRSGFVPTSPTVKDSNGVVISSNKLGILRYMIGTRNSAEYRVTVRDNATLGPDVPIEVPTLFWSSTELSLGSPRVNTEDVSIVPCRTAAETTTMEVYTEGLQELNVVSLEYACRYNQKYRRR